MYYKLFIEGDSGEKIEITDKNGIQSVEFNLYQNEQFANDRSDQLYADVTIFGQINSDNKNETKEISDWSRKKDSSSVYKTVSIQVFENNDPGTIEKGPIRDFYLKFMFCFSYDEKFSNIKNEENDNSWGNFCLKMKQRKGEINTIKVE